MLGSGKDSSVGEKGRQSPTQAIMTSPKFQLRHGVMSGWGHNRPVVRRKREGRADNKIERKEDRRGTGVGKKKVCTSGLVATDS